MYQTNDGNSRKSCASPLRARARTDDADTGEGSAAGGREKLEAGDGGVGGTGGGGPNCLREENSQTEGHRCAHDDTVEDKRQLMPQKNRPSTQAPFFCVHHFLSSSQRRRFIR